VTEPYYCDEQVTLHLGNARDILPTLDQAFDLAVVDPPYGETSLAWDRWLDDWPSLVAPLTKSMWCFGSMRMFLEHYSEFTTPGWKLSQDIVWEKHNGSGFQADRFKRVHEHVLHWYQGDWRDQYHNVQTTPDATARTLRRKRKPTHTGQIGDGPYASEDGGPRLMRSVIQVRSMHGRAIHPTEKPLGILHPILEYACPRLSGMLLDPFAGSGSSLDAARQTGRKAVGIEGDEKYCEAIANRLSQGVLGDAT
jgi:site-specific DNA-methyltransferase (adenine-specific)